VGDLRRMQELVAADWRGREPPRHRHIGDLAWGWHVAPGERRVRLWSSAWAWYLAAGVHEVHVAEYAVGTALHHEVLAWLEDQDGEPVVDDVLDTDVHTLAVLESRGYRRVNPRFPFVHLARALDELPEPAVPPGYTLRHVTPGDVERRVEVHRAAFESSRLTIGLYESLMRTYPYRQDLDWIAEAADRSLAAYACCWLDQENGVAELEPVGTHPEHTRRGLARAVCTAAIRRAGELGARWVIVYARADDAYSAPKRLYESMGFRQVARVLELQLERG